MKQIIALICGLLFGIGLTVSQMVDPAKVLNFLDLFGTWDASLMFVMGGALVVFGLGYFTLIKPRTRSLLDEPISLPSKTTIDKPLLTGAVIFGLGWGLSGVCPGPAIANITGFNEKMLGFIAIMLFGMWLTDKLTAQTKTQPTQTGASNG